MRTEKGRTRRLTALARGIVAVLSLFITATLAAQEFRATLTGVVTDESGAVMARADVLAINNATQQQYKAATTKQGTYYIPYVIPGEYTVKVSANGFDTQIQDNVLLQASEYRGLNFTMHVGSVSQNVTVSDAPPLLNTASGSGTTVLSEQEIESAPLQGREIYSLLSTTPSTQNTTTNVVGTTQNSYNVTNTYVVGGGMSGYQQFNLNGTNITAQSTGSAGEWQFAPNVDALQEVSVMTNTYDARYGRTGNGTINMVVKNGTNQFHGDLYEYIENTVFNANSFTNNETGIKRQATRLNQFGGTIGGPVIKDKVFFFGSYEGFRQSLPDTTLTSVPTLAMRPANGNGADFSGTGYTVYDPETTVCTAAGGSLGNCAGDAYTRTAFTNNVIPANRINPIGSAVLNLYPMPNIATTNDQNNYIANTPAQTNWDQYMARVDYNTSQNMRWYSLFTTQHGTFNDNSNGFTGVAEYGTIGASHDQYTAAQDLTWTLSPTTLLDVKVSYARFLNSSPDGNFAAAQAPGTIGLTMPSIPTTSMKALPEFSTTQYYPHVVGNILTSGSYNDIGLSVDLTKELGPHAIHIGGDYHHYDHGTPGQAGAANGQFEFGTLFTQKNPTESARTTDGFDIADMLLGDPVSSNVVTNTTSQVQWNPQTFTYYPAWDLYLQDDWRVRKNLTLNLGIRYDVQVGARARGNAINRGMCLTCVNSVSSNSGYQSNLAADASALTAAGIDTSNLSSVYGGIQFAGANGQPKNAYDTQWNNVAPRLGFAWQLDPLTVIRGGYGMMWSFGLENGTYSGYDQTTTYDASNDGGLTSSGYFASGNPFPNGAQEPAGAAGGDQTSIGNTQSLDFPQRKIPYSHMASLGFQRALPDQMTLDVRYAGDYSYNIRTSTTLNAVSATQLQKAIANPNYFSQLVPNPYYGVLPVTSTIGSSKTIKALTLMQPYSEFGQVSWDAAPIGRNLYSALEVKVDKRMGGPEQLAFQAAYTWSKNMQGNSFTNSYPYQDTTVRYQIGPNDRTNIFSLTSQLHLPFGRGQRFANDANRWVNSVIGGWQFSSILSAEGGVPAGINNSYYYNCDHSFRPNGGTSLKSYLYNDYSSSAGLGCYATIPTYALKTLGARVSSVRAPTEPNLDATLQKSFPLKSGYVLTFRADAFNLTNSVLFPAPDSNPSDGAPKYDETTGGYTGYGTVSLVQQNNPRILQFALKLKF
ncbi:carboxypeptidase regulatory-like domain-containing protein [Silvibacterium acidisoli]|uniref:carboxypeptidase regulatory-like domain-containing protein n=1 Tax=Acidobacteriaceae bacterium ZG23-2 TaxID=2883246 RepID=UPI00406D2F1C